MQIHSSAVVILLTISILLGLIIGCASSDSADGLKCWICTSLIDSKCSDDDFAGKPSDTILQRECRLVPSASENGLINRTIAATTCLKSTFQTKGIVLVSRGCASPGDLWVEDAISAKCITENIPSLSASAVVCLCKGDYCNGSQPCKLTTPLTMLLLGIAIILGKFAGEMNGFDY